MDGVFLWCAGDRSSFIYRFRIHVFSHTLCWFFFLPFPTSPVSSSLSFLRCTRLQAADPLASLNPHHLPAWQSCILLDYSSCRLLTRFLAPAPTKLQLCNFLPVSLQPHGGNGFPSVSGPGHLNTPRFPDMLWFL